MMKSYCKILGIALLLMPLLTKAQDTFSIVAIDATTGEVGSAGASCVDLDAFNIQRDDFLGELFPGVGAINTQASYLESNQAIARDRMNMGETPQQIINYVTSVDGSPQIRQYGIVGYSIIGLPIAAAYTGTSTLDYKGHITSNTYAIQGNILSGPEILDSMEARFLRANGDLACKLMAALQGANVVGADSRCAANGTSSLFAFLKVAQPSDTFGDPSFLVSVRTSNGDGIEPVDSLQVLFDSAKTCLSNPVGLENDILDRVKVYPNPAKDVIYFEIQNTDKKDLSILNMQGERLKTRHSTTEKNVEIKLDGLDNGMYLYEVQQKERTHRGTFIKN